MPKQETIILSVVELDKKEFVQKRSEKKKHERALEINYTKLYTWLGVAVSRKKNAPTKVWAKRYIFSTLTYASDCSMYGQQTKIVLNVTTQLTVYI